ncbi:hypothetical protein PSU4_20000 [Pseudonocardia sulfidoxydans NBRC 16205]|uniref:Oxygen sensor histidine kinase NreB n=1 Tax=Pseudonocardia sulfidoxydans NBRC 16205 TaxID=1223511 RepID=A0A511DE40_9PSEU|nr:sensor histidine kinase [Pseudonocardia sulfidoxydans]GEL23046.1 hypothetical protein PSU4_20000 [Pseudonocardia sulfidoxydans NBRC 16205]
MPSTAAVLALVVAAACVAGTVLVATAEIALVDVPRPPLLDVAAWASAAPGTALVIAGAVLTLRVPRHPMTWLLLLGGALTAASGFATGYALWSVVRHGGGWPGTGLATQLGARTGPLLNLIPPLVLLWFPDGRLPYRRWRPLVALSLTASAFAVLVLALAPWRLLGVAAPGVADAPIPLPLTDEVWAACLGVVPWLVATSPLVPAAVFLSRFRAADRQRQAQLRWMLLAAVLNLLLMAVPALVGPGWATDLAFVLSMVALAAAVLVAVTRFRLYDIDRLLGRLLVYGLLAAAIVGLDLAVFVGTSAALGDPVAAVVGAGAVAVAYAPLRSRIERLRARLLPGHAEPYAVISDLADRLERAGDQGTQLEEVARTVATAVGSPYVRVELGQQHAVTAVAEHGTPAASVVVLPFAYRDDVIGRLVLVPPTTAPPRARQQLLADVVRQAAAAVRLTAVSRELQRSREELVTRVAEERRRLRRDLHDGLGPTLAAAALKVQAAGNLAGRDLPAARAALTEVAGDLAGVLSDVRVLVHDLRPPALDRLGLDGAVRRLAARFGGGLEIEVRAVGIPAVLPAAVEEAAYHVVGEALANASRHARASRVCVTLSHDGAVGHLRVEVGDDGRGIPADAAEGVGLVTMRERAEELGGRCTVGPAPDGGTVVSALLPLRPAPRPTGDLVGGGTAR